MQLSTRYRITRRCLAVLTEAANPCSITTRGTLILRDLDLLQDLAAVTCLSVHVSLITLDRDLCRRLEPSTPPPASRLRVLARLRAAGIPVSVFLAPIVPGVTDGEAALAEVVRAAAEHGAGAVWPGVLRLAPGVKDWFLAFLQREFPHLAASYARGYATGANAPRTYRDRVGQRVMAATAAVTFTPAPEPPIVQPSGQLTLSL